MTCEEVENKLVSFIEDSGDRAVAAHLETCGACRELAHAQTVARTVLQARGAQLSPIAPPGLRPRLRALMEDRAGARQAPADGIAGWTGRLSAFAAAAMVVLTLGAVLLPVATIRSTT